MSHIVIQINQLICAFLLFCVTQWFTLAISLLFSLYTYLLPGKSNSKLQHMYCFIRKLFLHKRKISTLYFSFYFSFLKKKNRIHFGSSALNSFFFFSSLFRSSQIKALQIIYIRCKNIVQLLLTLYTLR